MKRRCRIVPAILTSSPEDLARMLRQAEAYAEFVQVDFMDGRFVPSGSISCQDIAALGPKVRWEAHLMIRDPEEQFQAFARAGAEKIVFHLEATSAPQRAIRLIRRLEVEAGLAVNPETPLAAVLPLAGLVDSVLFLTVHPGFYGAEFLPGVLDKVADLRARTPYLDIGVDGGIKEGNVARVARLGLDHICVGSAICMQPDPGAACRHLQALADQACGDGGRAA